MPKTKGEPRCPICKTAVAKTDAEFPFCSDRCRLLDLGKWASGAYRISSPVTDPEAIEQIEDHHERKRDDKETIH